MGGTPERGFMKRMLVCAGSVVALVLATTAFAATRHFSGTVDGGGTVSFATKFKDGKTKTVIPPVKFTAVPISCDQGDTVLTYILKGDPIRVTNRKFTFLGASGRPSQAKITGTFTNHGRNATGTFRDHGNFASGAVTGCDTGTVDWTAHK
jgi:hypothetical protein